MDALVTQSLLDTLMIAITFSIILMALVQKFKCSSLITKSWQIWLINLILSFSIGIPFSMFFYELDIYYASWVGLFSFIGAPAIYEALKKQNIIQYTPKSLRDTITISKENEIKRD